jgi:hypothetical protein
MSDLPDIKAVWPTLVEVKDGLLMSPDEVIMKAREPELFPDLIQNYFKDKDKVQYKKIEFGLDRVTVRFKDKNSVYDAAIFDYLKTLGRIDCYLSNVPLPGEEAPYYPLFARYRHGWVVVSPLGVA